MSSGGYFEAFEDLQHLPNFTGDFDDTAFFDNLYQILAEAEEAGPLDISNTQVTDSHPTATSKRRTKKDFLVFKRAVTLTQSLHPNTQPSAAVSRTAVRAYLWALKGEVFRLKRFRTDLMWPAHSHDLPQNQLFNGPSEESKKLYHNRTEPFLAFNDAEKKIKEQLDVSGKGPDYRIDVKAEDPASESESEEPANSELRSLSQSPHLQAALERTVHSIWRAKKRGTGECDRRTAYAIARRCSLMLGGLFEQVISNRKAALKLLKKLKDDTEDIDAVPSNWQAVKAAMNRLNVQLCLDDEILELFLDKLKPLQKST